MTTIRIEAGTTAGLSDALSPEGNAAFAGYVSKYADKIADALYYLLCAEDVKPSDLVGEQARIVFEFRAEDAGEDVEE